MMPFDSKSIIIINVLDKEAYMKKLLAITCIMLISGSPLAFAAKNAYYDLKTVNKPPQPTAFNLYINGSVSVNTYWMPLTFMTPENITSMYIADDQNKQCPTLNLTVPASCQVPVADNQTLVIQGVFQATSVKYSPCSELLVTNLRCSIK